MNGFDELAKKALEELRNEIDIIIDGMEDGITFDSKSISEAMTLRLLHARESLALARYSDSVSKVFDKKNKP
ncbi:hypothetical protein KAR91_02005 [Candidatus Pacearchaeota archaeon]|nr:hypothetical protein [Candidatus Pacearchaeota archaeon]